MVHPNKFCNLQISYTPRKKEIKMVRPWLKKNSLLSWHFGFVNLSSFNCFPDKYSKIAIKFSSLFCTKKTLLYLNILDYLCYASVCTLTSTVSVQIMATFLLIRQIDYIVAFIGIHIAIPYCNGYTGSQIDNTHTGNPYSSTRKCT